MGAGEGGKAFSGIGVAQGDMGVGDGGVLGVPGLARDGPGERSLGACEGGKQEQQEREQAV